MTSVLTNVRSHFQHSGMSNESSRYQYADLSKPLASSSSSASTPHNQPSSSYSVAGSMQSNSSLALAAATPATSMSSGLTPSDSTPLPQLSVMPPSNSSLDPNALYGSSISTSRHFDPLLGAYTESPNLADIPASCPPDGSAFGTTDFDAELAAAAFAPIFDAASLDSSVPLSFPVLPASLLDEAPEYEYVSLTKLTGCPCLRCSHKY